MIVGEKKKTQDHFALRPTDAVPIGNRILECFPNPNSRNSRKFRGELKKYNQQQTLISILEVKFLQ